MWSIPYPACAQNMVSMKFLSYKLGYIELGGHARFAAPATSRFCMRESWPVLIAWCVAVGRLCK
jgi:hypothetical protein